MAVAVTTGTIRHANLQSNHHHQQTNIRLFIGRMPFLSPNQHRQSTEGKISHSMDLLTSSSPGGGGSFKLGLQGPRREVCFQASTQPLANNLLLCCQVVTMFSVLEAC